MQDLISVIIPAYNSDRYIYECLCSVQRQTYPFFEVIIIDDGSCDNTSKICEQMSREDERISVVRQPNLGVSQARNKGIDLARGIYLTFLDSDDMLHPLFLENLIKRIIKTGADAAGCSFKKMPTGCIKTEAERMFQTASDPEWISISASEILQWFHEMNVPDLYNITCKLIRKDLIGDLRFERGVVLGEDTLLMYQLAKKGFSLELTREPWYLYRMHSLSAVHNWHHVERRDPYAVYLRIRDEECRKGRYEYADRWEASYLALLIQKYDIARKYKQKKVCGNLRKEACRALLYRRFTNSRILFFLTFFCPSLFRICSDIINYFRKKRK